MHDWSPKISHSVWHTLPLQAEKLYKAQSLAWPKTPAKTSCRRGMRRCGSKVVRDDITRPRPFTSFPRPRHEVCKTTGPRSKLLSRKTTTHRKYQSTSNVPMGSNPSPICNIHQRIRATHRCVHLEQIIPRPSPPSPFRQLSQPTLRSFHTVNSPLVYKGNHPTILLNLLPQNEIKLQADPLRTLCAWRSMTDYDEIKLFNSLFQQTSNLKFLCWERLEAGTSLYWYSYRESSGSRLVEIQNSANCGINSQIIP